MSKTIRKIVLICVAFFALICSVFATYFIVTAQGNDAKKVNGVIYTFDSDLFVGSAYAATASITSENGYMCIQSTASNEDGFFCSYEAPQDINAFELSNYRYLKVKLKRENCNGRFQLYFFKKENWVESTLYRCGFSLGSEYDGVWVELIIDLPVYTTSENAVYIKNLETGETVVKPFTDINPDQYGVSMNNYAGEFSSFRFNLSRGDANLEKRALMEYMAFFNDFDDAQAYNGSSRERLSSAEDKLLNKAHVSEFALSEKTEEKIVKLANDYFANELGVSVEVVNYTYQYPTQTEYGYMDCDIRLVSGGLYHYVENIHLDIEPEPTTPILYKFNDEESINTLLAQGKTSVEAYLYEGVMKMVQPDPLFDDGFWVVLDTVADNNRFLMQSYPIIKYRINVTGQGPSQLFFANYASYYSYGIGYDESVWLTVTFDTAKTTDAVRVFNEETGVVSYYPSMNAVYSVDFTPPAFRGLSDEFRFNFGRRSGLERTALLDYIGFFPTMESAMQYEQGGAKAITGIQNTLQNGTLEMDYAEGATKANAINSAKLMIEELGKDNFAVRLESVIYTAPVLNEKKGEIRATAVLTDSKGESYTVAVKIAIGHYATSKEQGLYFTQEAVLSAMEKSANTQIAFANGLQITGTAQPRAVSVSSLAVADKINLGAYKYLALGVNENYDGEVYFTATTENGVKRFAITPNGKGNTVIELGNLVGILNGFSVECTKDMTLRYITFFERETDALAFTGVSNRQQVVGAELAKIKNLTIGETPAANCYTEREATAVAKKLLEKTLSEGSRAEVIPVELVKPTKTATGYFQFKVRLVLGGTFTSVSAESEVISLPISKIKRYEYIEEYYRFDGESYAESEEVVGEFKTIEVLLKANGNDGYIVGNDSFTLLANAGELQLISGEQTLFTTQDFNLKSRGLVHIAITVDRQNNKTVLFVDGQKVLERDITFNTTNASILFVAGTPTKRVKFNGYISTVRVWENLRTQEQINAYRYDKLLGSESGLLQYWLFDDTNEFINRANYENSLKLVQVYKNYYHEFTGYDYLKTEKAIAYTPKTVEFWLQPFVEQQIECSLIANTLNATATTGDFRLRLLENGDLQLDYGETRLFVTGINAYSGVWKHIAFVFADTETRVYLNGEPFTTLKAVSGALKATTYYLGGDKTGKVLNSGFVDGNFIGKMANVRFWSTARTPSELQENAQKRLTNESGLLWNLSLHISDNLVFADSVNGNNAKIVSESWYKIVNENKKDYFTSVILPDPQDYIVGTVARQGRDWDSYDEWRFYNYNLIINDWIVDNVVKENIQMVLTVGDLTQNATIMEFEIFKEHMSILDGVVPYTLVLGNHDLQSMMGYGSDTRGCNEFNTVFDFDEWSKRSYYGGAFEYGNLDNTYYVMQIGNEKYLVMCLEFYPRDEVLEWAEYIAKKYADHKIIVTTHNNLSRNKQTKELELTSGIPNYGLAGLDGATTNHGVGIWNKFVKRNPNVIQVVSGHVGHFGAIEMLNNEGEVVRHVVADTWTIRFNGNDKVESLVGLNRYYQDGSMSLYLYDPAKDAYYVTSERYELDGSYVK